jgi:hypothetical protein
VLCQHNLSIFALCSYQECRVTNIDHWCPLHALGKTYKHDGISKLSFISLFLKVTLATVFLCFFWQLFICRWLISLQRIFYFLFHNNPLFMVTIHGACVWIIYCQNLDNYFLLFGKYFLVIHYSWGMCLDRSL